MSDNLEKILDKIQKLLALSHSPSESEAMSAYAKAHELLKKYNLEESDLPGEKPNMVQKTAWKAGKLHVWYIELAIGVAEQNYCSLFIRHKYREHAIIIVGRKSNVEVAKELYWYLLASILHLSKGKGNSYRFGMAKGIIDRLKTNTKEHALMLISSEAVAAVEEITLGKSSKIRKLELDPVKFEAGRRDQRVITLTTGDSIQ